MCVLSSTGISLNPCFSGTYSRSLGIVSSDDIAAVLILVLVEHTLGDIRNVVTNTTKDVLILVLVEHTLGVMAVVLT